MRVYFPVISQFYIVGGLIAVLSVITMWRQND